MESENKFSGIVDIDDSFYPPWWELELARLREGHKRRGALIAELVDILQKDQPNAHRPQETYFHKKLNDWRGRAEKEIEG